MKSEQNQIEPNLISRRWFVRGCAVGAATLASASVLRSQTPRNSASQPARSGAASRVIPLDRDWLFGGKFQGAATTMAYDDAALVRVNLPHAVTRQSWQNWDPASWEDVWVYRKHFTVPSECKGLRVFLHFDGVMVGTTPTINGATLAKHLGGYLPSRYEITEHVKDAGNVLAVEVDSRWSDVPPEGSVKGSKRVDYLEIGGIYRGVRLEAVPAIFIRDLFAKPVNVLDPARRVEVICTLDATATATTPMQIRVEMTRDGAVVSQTQQDVTVSEAGETEVKLTLANLGNVALWDVDSPNLYEVSATLLADGQPVHDCHTRIGLREAKFGLDGFFLNGRRLQLFGLNRHEIFPYVGGAMPRRVMRRDAQILKHEFNCNMVRCSHYPQSEAFLDACDEMGLMVWEEVPGWGYLGDDAWKELLVGNVRQMITRDRNHPAIVIWGTRANESANDVPLYRRTKELAKSLDDSRPTSGSMTPGSRRTWKQTWHEDVFAFDDYHTDRDGTVGMEGPTAGVPYLFSEAVGQFNYTKRKSFDSYYRRAGDVGVQQQQAVRHAQAHSKAAANPRICGVIAWCAFDYASQVNAFNNVKTPGVADVFRIPKIGAAFYQAQTDAKAPPLILPAFYWDFGPQTPRGPGKDAAIFSNCDRLEVFLNGQAHATLHPDVERYPHLRHAPFFVDLDVDGSGHPELRIDGYLENRQVLSRSFSSDPAQDQLFLKADDDELIADGSDATRLMFKVVDRFGADRLLGGGQVQLQATGPADLVGDNPFSLADSGGVGAVWIKAQPGGGGPINVTATHSALGKKSVTVNSRRTEGPA